MTSCYAGDVNTSQSPAAEIVIAGAGAAGTFAAIACAAINPRCRITLLEKSPELLSKVAISGGGRCNVTHACYEPRLLCEHYPRGGKELLGPFSRWQPQDTVNWFQERGVLLKTEADGRMFPVSDQSFDVVNCLVKALGDAGVEVFRGIGLRTAARSSDGFTLALTDGSQHTCDRLLLATGGNRNSAGIDIAASLGHTIEDPIPSLFTFHISDARLLGLSGISVDDAEVSVPETGLRQRGAVLITHWGLSGPAVLKLSAWGARELHVRDYTFPLCVNWAPGLTPLEIAEMRRQRGGQMVHGRSGVAMPGRLWAALATAAGIGSDVRWANLTSAQQGELHRQLTECRFQVVGKSMFKEEFVTCGGVRLSEIDFRTMQSKLVPGLYFAGEVLDIDGVTGGFNLQAAWTTGRIAGEAMGGGRG